MRMGKFQGGRRVLADGDRRPAPAGIRASPRVPRSSSTSAASRTPCDPGHRIVLADGQAEIVVESVEKGAVVARRQRAAVISATARASTSPIRRPAYELPTEQDKRHLALAAEAGVDLIGASFVSRPEKSARSAR